MRRVVAVPIVGITLVLVSCGGGGDSGDSERVLHLRGGDFTESHFTANVRALLIADASFCDSLKGLSAREVADAFKAVNDAAGATPKQGSNANDEERGGEIIQEECNRVNP